jgi:hypothetical protein
VDEERVVAGRPDGDVAGLPVGDGARLVGVQEVEAPGELRQGGGELGEAVRGVDGQEAGDGAVDSFGAGVAQRERGVPGGGVDRAVP